MFSQVLPLVIFLINFIPALFLFRFPALQPSVEPTIWVQAKFIVDNFPNLSWFDNWYLGYPFRFSGPPVFVYLLAVLHKMAGVPIPTLDGIITALSLAVFSVGVYFLAKFLTKNNWAAFFGALIFTTLPSAGYIFPQASFVGSQFGFLPWRITSFLTFGGGVKLVGFAILPFIILLFWQTIIQFSRKNFILIVVLLELLLLTDNMTFLSFLIFSLAIIAAEGFKGEWIEKAKGGALIIVAAVGLSAFWYTPSYLMNIFASPSLAGLSLAEAAGRLFQFLLVAVPVFFGVFGFLGRKLEKNAIFVILSLGFFSFLTLLYWATDTDFLTEYSRFFTEIDLVIALAIGLTIQKLKVKSQNFKLKFKTNETFFLFVVLTFAFLVLSFRWLVFNQPNSSYHPKLEKEIANWLSEKTSPTERVYLSGSTAFWLNWFAPNVAQVRGGVDHAATNPFWAHASFNLREGENPQTALAWLKALRVSYVVVHESNSSEFYGDFKNPQKFETIGEKVFDNGEGDKIYKIQAPVLAKAVDGAALNLKKPKDGADLALISGYTKFLENGRGLETKWFGTNKILIKAKTMEKEEGISLGVTYDSGWEGKLKTQNLKLKIRKDPIGNIFTDPKTSGDLEIELRHSPRWDNWIGYFISVLTLFPIFKPAIAAKLFSKFPKLHFGLEEES